MRGRLLVVLAGLTACGSAQPASERPPADPAKDVTQALADGVKLVRARRLDEAEQTLAIHRSVAARDPHLLEKLDYYIATVLVYRGEIDKAERLIAAHAQSAASRGDVDSEAWMISSLVWLHWAAADLPGALAANERLATLAQAEEVDAGERRAWRLQQLWDRSFLMIEQAYGPDQPDRAGALAKAEDVRQEYESLCGEPDDRGLAALASWKAWRMGDIPTAARDLLRVDVDDESDARHLFVVVVVSQAAGDRPRAERARARLGNMVNLLVPLLLRVPKAGLGRQQLGLTRRLPSVAPQRARRALAPDAGRPRLSAASGPS